MSALPLTFAVGGDPVPKGRPRVTKSGHAFTPKETRAYEEEIAEAGRAAVAATPGWPAAKGRTLTFRLAIIPNGKKKLDADNVFKSAADALNKVAYHDDSDIDVIEVVRLRADPENPHVVVHLSLTEYAESKLSVIDGVVRAADALVELMHIGYGYMQEERTLARVRYERARARYARWGKP